MTRFALALAAALPAALVAALGLSAAPAQAGGFRFCVECGGGLQYYGDKAYMRGPDLTIGGHAEWPSARQRRERRRARESVRDRPSMSRRRMHEIVRARRAGLEKTRAIEAANRAAARRAAAAEAEAEKVRMRSKARMLAKARAARHAAARAVANVQSPVQAVTTSPPTTTPTTARIAPLASEDQTAAETKRAAAQDEQTAKAEEILRALMDKPKTAAGETSDVASR